MERPVAVHGERLSIVFAVRRIVDRSTGKVESPGRDYFAGLSKEFQIRFAVSFKMLADRGILFNEEKFKKVDAHYFEFKANPHRLLCRFVGRTVVITNGFEKKKRKLDRDELARADEIFRADESLAKIGLIRTDRK